jgi:hypothetical protein
MKLFIPACGNRIKLTSDWTFNLYYEGRNLALFNKVKGWSDRRIDYRAKNGPESVTMSAGTTLEVDRVYIRTFSKNAPDVESDYDSLTFKVIDGTYAKIRFWAKLSDVNNIEYELPPDVKGSKGPSTAPKKMKIDKVRDEIASATRYVTRNDEDELWGYMHSQPWRTPVFMAALRKVIITHTSRRIAMIDAELETLKNVKTFEEWYSSITYPMCLSGCKQPDDVQRKRQLTNEREALKSSFLHELGDLLDKHSVKPVRDESGRLVRKWVGNTSQTTDPNYHRPAWEDRVCLVKDVVFTITMTPDESAIESVTLTCGEEL